MAIRFGQGGFCERRRMWSRRKKPESNPTDFSDALEIGFVDNS